LIFSCQKYIIKSKIVLIASEFLISAKFRENIKIPWQKKNSVTRLETVGPTNYSKQTFEPQMPQAKCYLTHTHTLVSSNVNKKTQK